MEQKTYQRKSERDYFYQKIVLWKNNMRGENRPEKDSATDFYFHYELLYYK